MSRGAGRLHLKGMNPRFALLLLTVLQACNPVLMPIYERKGTPLTGSPSSARVIWTLDTSGSLLLPIDASAPGCPSGCGVSGNPCPATCATRRSELPIAFGHFFAELPPDVSHSTVFFPTDPVCGGPTEITQGLSPSDVLARVNGINPVGGTPTGNALRFVAEVPPLEHTDTFVVLITDGLPNCNASNPHNICADPDDVEALTRCQCTTATCRPQSLCSIGCLDQLGPATASHLLVERGQRLMAIGFGKDLSTGLGPELLSSMELTVGPECASSADCGGKACGADGLCTDKLMLASSGADFQKPAEVLGTAVKKSLRCTWWLPRQVTTSDLTVSVGGNEVPAAQWKLVGTTEQRVVISGAACDALLAGTDAPTITWLPPAE